MDEVLTIDEINLRYPNEWVLITDPVTDEYLRVLQGRVTFHSPNRGEMLDKAVEMKPRHWASHYTGKPRTDLRILL